MMSGKEKLYFLLDAIDDAKVITPAGKPLIIDPTNDLNRNYRDIELLNLFNKLEKDERVLKVVQVPIGAKDYARRRYGLDTDLNLDFEDNDGCWHVQLLPNFEKYHLKIQHEPEYQEFTGKRPPTPLRAKLSRKALEKIWTVLQEIEDKRGITPAQDDISIPFVHFSKVKDEIGAINASDEKRNILRKLENEEYAIRDVRFPDNLQEYVYLKIGNRYSETFDYYEKEYKNAAKNYQDEQQAQQALRPTILPRHISSPVTKISPEEIVNEFSSQNYPFVSMVLKKIASLVEFSTNKEAHYQLQSPAGQLLIQERQLLKKLEAQGLFSNKGEDGIFGIATLGNIDLELVKQIIEEIKKRGTEVGSREEKYTQTIKEIKKSNLQERYEKALSSIAHKPHSKPQKIDSNNEFSLIENILSINQKQIKFKKDARTLALLKLLIKKSKGIYFSEEANKLEGAIVDDKKEPKNTYYEVCRGIENRLAKIGVTNFLQYDFNQAKINPQYKSTTK